MLAARWRTTAAAWCCRVSAATSGLRAPICTRPTCSGAAASSPAARQSVADGHNPDAFHGVGVLARSCAVGADARTPASGQSSGCGRRRTGCRAGFNRAFAADVSLVDRVAPAPLDRAFSDARRRAPSTAPRMHPHGIYAWEESARQSSLFGCELSAPLLDRRIAEFADGDPGRAAVVRATDQARAARRDGRHPAGRCPDRPPQVAILAAAVFGAAQAACTARERLHEWSCSTRGILDRAAVDGMYREMVRLFAGGQDRYKVLALRLWTLFGWRLRLAGAVRP